MKKRILARSSARTLLLATFGSAGIAMATAAPAQAYYWGGLTCSYYGSGQKCQNGGGNHSWQTVAIHADADWRPGFCAKTALNGNAWDGTCITPGNTWAEGFKTHVDGNVRTAYGYWAGSASGGINEHVNADTNWT